ncbi:MAG: hypothetical protein H6Q76_1514, partial [Firmicutes bacterium]|nr:hypothetical protein [Bacillota bacterium]
EAQVASVDSAAAHFPREDVRNFRKNRFQGTTLFRTLCKSYLCKSSLKLPPPKK